MARIRLIGMILIGIGFLMAVGAGLILAVAVREGRDVLVTSLVAFVVIAPVVIGGIYFYVRSGEDEEDAGDSLILKQRDLMDLLRADGAVKVDEAAAALEIEIGLLRELVNQLAELQVFSGYWVGDTLYTAQADKLRGLTACVNCQNPLQLVSVGVNPCPHCEAVYFLP